LKSTKGLWGKNSWGQFHQHSISSFYSSRSQKLKKTDSLTVFFALLASAHVQAACRTLKKLTPDVHGINNTVQSSLVCNSRTFYLRIWLFANTILKGAQLKSNDGPKTFFLNSEGQHYQWKVCFYQTIEQIMENLGLRALWKAFAGHIWPVGRMLWLCMHAISIPIVSIRGLLDSVPSLIHGFWDELLHKRPMSHTIFSHTILRYKDIKIFDNF